MDLGGPQIGKAECYSCGRFVKAVCVDRSGMHEHWCTDCIPPEVLVVAALEEKCSTYEGL